MGFYMPPVVLAEAISLAQLSDVNDATPKTGTGDTVVMQGNPTINGATINGTLKVATGSIAAPGLAPSASAADGWVIGPANAKYSVGNFRMFEIDGSGILVSAGGAQGGAGGHRLGTIGGQGVLNLADGGSGTTRLTGSGTLELFGAGRLEVYTPGGGSFAMRVDGTLVTFNAGSVNLDVSMRGQTGELIRTDADLGAGAGGLGFFGVTPVVRPAAYTASNVVADRSYNADATTIDELADVVGTLIADLRSLGLVQ